MYIDNTYGDQPSGTYTNHQDLGYIWTFDAAQNERWFDTDRDGWIDYGRRDVGEGHWWTFEGVVWRNAAGEIMETVEPEHRGSYSADSNDSPITLATHEATPSDWDFW